MSDGSHSPSHSDVLTPDDESTDTMSDNPQLSPEQSVSPKVAKRVEFLEELQKEFEAVQAEFFEERSQLMAKYEKLYEPIFNKRYEIVNGIKDVEDTDEADQVTEENSEKGIPKFWLTAMKANEKLAELITEDDEGALQYLEDIKCRLEDSKAFKLGFFFSANPYFRNSVLEKTYMVDKVGSVSVKAEGTEIEWLPGKCLTVKVLQMMPRKRSSSDIDNKPLTNTEKCESFFNFFNPPLVQDEDDEDDAPIEEIQKDYELGCVIRDQIIPQAVSWFKGECTDADFFDL
ncbi:nucleosome assembly protein 1;4-like [Vigna unguiculata]|uniref:Nucleosome assembly protein 1-like 1 n=1 Tax=Vigna unguiculata TaxID=3917 RepID=A0A4D6N5H5_VIGUN|nr:nucleosome assembly protein 1;4-like [Vigna unguiculata]QCE09063.1 nucleosome assembly protein 1-like 1 [Vigna unguiculata]